MQGFFKSVWDRVSAGFDLTNTVSENAQWDTAMAVAWLYDGLAPSGRRSTSTTWPRSRCPRRPQSRPSNRRRRPRRGRSHPCRGRSRPSREDPASVAIRDPVFAPANSSSADVIGRCSTRPAGRCFVEVASGLQRRAAVVRRGQLARLAFTLGPAQRRQLRDDCATELNVRVAVYQPRGQRARTARRTIQVLCAAARGHCAAGASSVFATRPLASPLAVLVRAGGRRRLPWPAETGRALNTEWRWAPPWAAGHSERVMIGHPSRRDDAC